MAAKPQRLLIISASIGGGHVAAGRALEAAASSKGMTVQHIDMLDYTTVPFRRLYQQTYFDLVRSAPDLVDWLGKRMDRLPSEQKGRRERIRARLTRLVSYRLPRLINRFEPDVIIHTHFLPPEILSTLGHKLSAPQAVVVTDFAAHSLWLQRGIRRYFVASSEVAAHLRSSGVDETRIVVSGIPIDARFGHLPAAAEARRQLELPVERDVLLIMASGLDKRTLLELTRHLKEFRWPLSAIIICGRSEELMDSLNRTLEDYQGPIHFQTLGFAHNLPLYMAAADLLVGKPGGLTSSEALAAALPFAVVQPYPLQEEANANYLLEHGVGLRIEPLTLLNHKLKLFFGDAARRQTMQATAQKLAKPDAALTVIESLLEQPL